MSAEASMRRLLPQDTHPAQKAHMSSFSFASQNYPQRETQKNYVFVDEHNRHKRLKVMRACEGCRRRKIKCDAATTNTWPCSACIRLKLHCVRPNGYDGAVNSSTTYDTLGACGHLPPPPPRRPTLHNSHVASAPPRSAPDFYASHGAFLDSQSSAFHSLSFETLQSSQNLHYTTVPPPPPPPPVSVISQQYAPHQPFPSPPLHHPPRPDLSPESASTDAFQQHDLADLLGGLKVNELGTAPYLRNKASFRTEEQPVVEEDDDFGSILPTVTASPGHKIRIPPELMPDEASALHYFDLFFVQIHPYVPVLDKHLLYRQWNTARDRISPLILEALFAMGGRLAEDPAQGQQWLALASRHADAFMDVPRLSTLQALLLILKAREAAPKRGYYYRSWMTVVQCVQMGKDLGLDEHLEDHRAGRSCGFDPSECQLRTRIWQTVFVCEVMVGTPQGRHELSVKLDTVDFTISRPSPGEEDGEHVVSRNFTYFARLVRNIGKMSKVYAKIKKRKEWGMDPEFQQLSKSITAFLAELPSDMSISFPHDSSPPIVPSPFLGNLHSYYYLTLILYHRPVISFLDPTMHESQWKHHMWICYNAARALCRLQEGILQSFGLSGLQCMQRGFSFTVYAGLCCIVLHLVALVSPDPELNSDARDYFSRHMRIMEAVMEAWPMPELQKQVDAVREAFSADVRRSFVLKPSFPYGSPHSSNPSSPNPATRYASTLGRTASNPPIDHQRVSSISYSSHPLSPPASNGPGDSKSDQASVQSLVMAQEGQGTDLPTDMALTSSQPSWNPARIFDQWNTSFGTPPRTDPPAQRSSLQIASAPSTPDVAALPDLQGASTSMPPAPQPIPAQSYSAMAPLSTFITPAMWQESVASVYEGGLKRTWDFERCNP